MVLPQTQLRGDNSALWGTTSQQTGSFTPPSLIILEQLVQSYNLKWTKYFKAQSWQGRAKYESSITPLNTLDFSKLNSLWYQASKFWTQENIFKSPTEIQGLLDYLGHFLFICERQNIPQNYRKHLLFLFLTTFLPSVTKIYQQKMLKSMMMQLRLWLHDDSKSILKQIISTVGQKERQTLWKSDPLISLSFRNPRDHL